MCIRDRLELEQLIVAEGLGHLVEMRGSQPIEAVYQAMQAHHVLLLPSIFEGFPLVIVEAQANGCVPVASHLAGITDMAIEDGVSGLLLDYQVFYQIKIRVAAESTDKTLCLVPTRHFTVIQAGRPPIRTIDFNGPNVTMNYKKI